MARCQSRLGRFKVASRCSGTERRLPRGALATPALHVGDPREGVRARNKTGMESHGKETATDTSYKRRAAA
eukprot:8077006-Pyramimonas_sp.AAC.1